MRRGSTAGSVTPVIGPDSGARDADRGRRRARARCWSRWVRRSRAASIIVGEASAFASRVSIWRSTRSRVVEDERAARSVGSWEARKRSRLRSRAASSSSSCPICGEREPGLVAELLDEAEALEVGRVVEAVRAFRSSRWLEQPASPRSSGSTAASGRSRLRLPGSGGAAHQRPHGAGSSRGLLFPQAWSGSSKPSPLTIAQP